MITREQEYKYLNNVAFHNVVKVLEDVLFKKLVTDDTLRECAEIAIELNKKRVRERG